MDEPENDGHHTTDDRSRAAYLTPIDQEIDQHLDALDPSPRRGHRCQNPEKLDQPVLKHVPLRQRHHPLETQNQLVQLFLDNTLIGILIGHIPCPLVIFQPGPEHQRVPNLK